jgi:hypothetical protein
MEGYRVDLLAGWSGRLERLDLERLGLCGTPDEEGQTRWPTFEILLFM